MTYINAEHKMTEAMLMIRLVEECLSSGVANQFSADALAGLSVSLKRARTLLSPVDEPLDLIHLENKILPEEVFFDEEQSDIFAEENFTTERPTLQSRRDLRNRMGDRVANTGIAKERNATEIQVNPRKFTNSRHGLTAKVEIESSEREFRVNPSIANLALKTKSQRITGQMGTEGPKINMNRKRLRAALEN